MFREKWLNSNENIEKKPIGKVPLRMPGLDEEDSTEEKMETANPGNEIKAKKHEFFGTRHGKAQYQLNESIPYSEDPESAPDASRQWFLRDLTQEGREEAQIEAEKFFDGLNPETDALFFASSDLVRAAETAKIYLDVAREHGFEIILPREKSEKNNAYDNQAEEIGEGYIRKINCLTLDHLENMLREFVFAKDDYLKKISHLENVSAETIEKWAQARAIIESDNKDGWGPNYAAHSEEIAEIFPNVKSAKQVYETKFKNMLRLMRFGQKKIEEQNPAKNIKILGFSHENSFLYFLNQNFGKPMKNCETIGFQVLPEEEEVKKREILVNAKGKNVTMTSDNEVKAENI